MILRMISRWAGRSLVLRSQTDLSPRHSYRQISDGPGLIRAGEEVRVLVHIDAEAATMARQVIFGSTYALVDPGLLSEAQREELLRCPRYVRRATTHGTGLVTDLEFEYFDPYTVPFQDQWDARGQLNLPPVGHATVRSVATLLDARPAILKKYLQRGAKRGRASILAVASEG